MKHLRSVISAYVTLKKFTPGLQKIYTDISTISATFSNSAQDSETPDTLREHDVTHWQKTVNCWDIARFMWIDHLFIPAMLCQQRCVRKSHTHGKNGCVRRYAAGTGVANALKVVQRHRPFLANPEGKAG